MIITNTKGERQVLVMLGETVEDVKEQMFLVAMENNSGNLKRVCRSLGVHYRTARHWKAKYAGSEEQELQA